MTRITLPAKVFVEAVLLTAHPCGSDQTGHPAMDMITEWWNASAPPELRSAFSFMYYVRYRQEDWPKPFWFSGCYEEGYLDDETFQRSAKPAVEAALADNVILTFTRRPITTWAEDGQGWHEALDVAGGEGSSGGTADGFTGEMFDTRAAYDALKLFPSRFPTTWAQLLLQADLEESPALQHYSAKGTYFFIEPQPASAAA